jgi:hypothetical protein
LDCLRSGRLHGLCLAAVQKPDALGGEPQLMFKELREEGGSSTEEGVGLRASLIQTYEEVGYEIDRSF